MNRYLFYVLAILILAALAVVPCKACDGYAFSSGACYSAPLVQAYAAPVQSYVAPVQAYAAPAQAVILPQRVEIVRPEVRLQLSQVQAYNYAAPLAVVAPQKVFVQKQVVAKVHAPAQIRTFQRRTLFGGTVTRQFIRQ